MSNTRIATTLFALLLCSAAASCGGGTLLPLPSADPLIALLNADDSITVYAPAGSADPGSTAETTVAPILSVTAAADGSFLITGLPPIPSNSVLYRQGNQLFEYSFTTATLKELQDFVTTPLFSTGSGPNDMLALGGNLVVANSLDNSVARYNQSGDLLSSSTFPLASSPSYLACDGSMLYAICNGTNEVQIRSFPDLTAVAAPAVPLDPGGAAFLGPAQSTAVTDGYIVVPLNNISNFGPTVFGTGRVAIVRNTSPASTVYVELPHGVNAQCSLADATRGLVYIVCAGDIQFDENFVPHAAGDAYLEVLEVASSEIIDSINLGPIGAGQAALSPDSAFAYLGNSLTGAVYKVDLDSLAVVRGAGNPIVLTTDYTFVSDLAFTPDGTWLLASSFNTDELYLIDPVNDTVSPAPYSAPFSLALDPQLLGGCIDVEVSPERNAHGAFEVFVLYGLANAVARVELLP